MGIKIRLAIIVKQYRKKKNENKDEVGTMKNKKGDMLASTQARMK